MLKQTILVIVFVLLTALSSLAQIPNAAEFNRTFTHHTANVNNVRLHYVIGGQGEPVVLLHGFAETWYMWRRIMPELAKRYTVIVPDLRGAGDSDKPATGYDKRTLAEDIYQLAQQLGYQRIFLVGHDIGLMVSYTYAAVHPVDVRRLVLLDAPGAMRAGFEYFRAFDKDARQNKEYFKRKLAMPVLALGGAQSLGPQMINMVNEVATNVRGGVIERCGHWIADERPEALTEQLLAFFGEEK